MVSLKEEDSAINAFAWGWVDEGRCGYAAEVEATLKAQHLPRPCWPVTKAQMNRPLRCAAGYRHTLFATAKGHLKVCGSDTYGQLGVGGPRDFAAAEREKVVEVQHHEDDRREFFKSVAAGDGTSYALSASGTLFGNAIDWVIREGSRWHDGDGTVMSSSAHAHAMPSTSKEHPRRHARPPCPAARMAMKMPIQAARLVCRRPKSQATVLPAPRSSQCASEGAGWRPPPPLRATGVAL